MATWQMIYLQDSNSPNTDYLYMFHDLAMLIIMMIISMIIFLMYKIFKNLFINRYLLQGHTIEIIWTTLPMFILMILAFPSLKILYFLDEMWINFTFTIKAIGHQWYWSYEYNDFGFIEFDSYMISTNDLNLFRLLDVDNRMIIPYTIPIRILTTSMDVIHSWAVPSLGIKMDSVPGRINQMLLITVNPGLYFGQCSEICGANHSFMPIVIESTTIHEFNKWMHILKLNS